MQPSCLGTVSCPPLIFCHQYQFLIEVECLQIPSPAQLPSSLSAKVCFGLVTQGMWRRPPPQRRSLKAEARSTQG